MRTSTSSETRPKAGRPRSAASRRAILDAAIAALSEDAPGAATIDAIAARAKAGKSTIYRWWPNRGALLLEALVNATSATLDVDLSATTRDALIQQIRGLQQIFANPRQGPLIVALTSEAQHDRATAAAFNEVWLATRRASAIGILRRGIDRGDLRPDLDLDLTVDALYAPLYHRALYRHVAAETAPAERIVDQILLGAAARMNQPDPPANQRHLQKDAR